MIREVKSHGIIPVITNLPPIDANKYIKWICRKGLNEDNIKKWLGSVDRIYKYQELYAQAVQNIALEESCHLIDVRSEFLQQKDVSQCLCEDGIHPNLRGHQLIYNAFSNFANNMKEFIFNKITNE